MRGQLKQSAAVLAALVYPKQERQIPHIILRDAKALVMMTTLGLGLGVSGIVGSGIIIKRLPDGKLSPPASIAALGAGYGLQAGARKTDTVIVLFTPEAIQ